MVVEGAGDEESDEIVDEALCPCPGPKPFALIDATLDVRAVAQMTTGLFNLASCSLAPVVTNNLAFCSPNDGDKTPSEAADGEGEAKKDCLECKLILIYGSTGGSKPSDKPLAAALKAAKQYFDARNRADCLHLLSVSSKDASRVQWYLGGEKWSGPRSTGDIATNIRTASQAKYGRKIDCFSDVLVFYHGEGRIGTGTSVSASSYVTGDVLNFLGQLCRAPIRRLVLWSCWGSDKVEVTGRLKNKFKTFKKKMAARGEPDCKCELCVYTAPSFKVNQAVQAVRNEKARYQGLEQETKRLGKDELARSLSEYQLGIVSFELG